MAREWFVSNHGAIPIYRRKNSSFSVQRVMDPTGPGAKYTKRWALFDGLQRVWELQAMPDPAGAILQADEWLQEHDLIRRYQR